MSRDYDAVIVGAGPNGLSAAIELASAGGSVLVLEAQDTIGGGTRSKELIQPGFVHDVCSAVHPLGAASPFFRKLNLEIDWIEPDHALAHPLDNGGAVLLDKSIETTAEGLGSDARRYRRLMTSLVSNAENLVEDAIGTLRIPKHPLLMARFGGMAALSALTSGKSLFRDARTRALFAGTAAHTTLPLRSLPAHALPLLFHVCAHTTGWPIARTGSQAIADALGKRLLDLGGEISCGVRVESLNDVPRAKRVFFDLTPRQIVGIAADALPSTYRNKLGRFQYGPGVFKIDYALDGPIPWTSREVSRAGVVHLGGTYEEIAAAEFEVSRGSHPQRPWVIVAQQSAFDPTRAPAGKHTAWVYCHVPNGSSIDMTERIENQIERFAPGFRDVVIARAAMGPRQLEQYNSNYIGGDIAGGSSKLLQLFMRPVAKFVPYATPNPAIFICSSSTPPGAGVHGMCGYFAARAALKVLRS